MYNGILTNLQRIRKNNNNNLQNNFAGMEHVNFGQDNICTLSFTYNLNLHN